MSVRIAQRGAVSCFAALDLPMSGTTVWGQLRDFNRYARQDLFHAELTIAGGFPWPGARLSLVHRYAGLKVRRHGRILIWREGTGYSFSDLSARGPRYGFPHVFSYRVKPIGEKSCWLEIEVRGKWTARGIPRWIARLWLRWVFGQIVRRVENEMMTFQLWRRKHESTR